jgi:recombination protein RecR
MKDFAPPVQILIDEFKKLPGIGSKSAQRLAFYMIRATRDDAEKLAQAIIRLKESIHYCSICNNITDTDPCRYCTDSSRDSSQICVVEEPHSLIAIEKTRQFHGLYHILQGVLSPLQGIGPDQLKIKGLLERLHEGNVREIIIATNPSVEGEATALYLSRLIKPLNISVSRIATGIPVGGDLDYADEITLSRALEGRRML